MPWKECSVMEERLRFVARLLDGEGMSEICREFGISRKTGYKIFNRYKQSGFEALSDRCRRPVRYANQLPPPIESLIVSCIREKPHWDAARFANCLNHYEAIAKPFVCTFTRRDLATCSAGLVPHRTPR